MSVPHLIKLGDTLTPLGATLKQATGTGTLAAVDLTGKTVKVRLVDSTGTEALAETTTGVTVVSAAAGTVQYDFQAADVDTAGTYYLQFVVYSGSERDTFPVDGPGRKVVIQDR